VELPPETMSSLGFGACGGGGRGIRIGRGWCGRGVLEGPSVAGIAPAAAHSQGFGDGEGIGAGTECSLWLLLRARVEIQRAIVQAQDMPPRIAQNVTRPILFTAHLRLEQLVEDANFYLAR
jgi:hypothetical protein